MSDRLLEVISTRGSMSLDDFYLAFDRLVPVADDQDLSFARRNALYALDALGHCEKDWNRRKIFACRPVLALLPAAGCPRAVLTGARSAQTVTDLKNYAKAHPDVAYVSSVPQADGLPDVITLEAADEPTMVQCAAACRLPLSGGLPAAWTLANYSGSLAQYEAALDWKPAALLNWGLRVFDPAAPCFRRADGPRAAGLLSRSPCLTEHTDPVTQQRVCRWTKDGHYASVAGDWGRWLALSASGQSVLLYDGRRQRLSVPSFVPLPRLLARAATLCSGRAAFTDLTLHRNIYDSVPSALAELIAGKCGLPWRRATLERESDHV